MATPLSSQPASHGGSIQPGVPTPLPPGVNLETLVGLCRLPEAQLLRLQLPQPLLSAISFWKMRQAAQGGVSDVGVSGCGGGGGLGRREWYGFGIVGRMSGVGEEGVVWIWDSGEDE